MSRRVKHKSGLVKLAFVQVFWISIAQVSIVSNVLPHAVPNSVIGKDKADVPPDVNAEISDSAENNAIKTLIIPFLMLLIAIAGLHYHRKATKSATNRSMNVSPTEIDVHVGSGHGFPRDTKCEFKFLNTGRELLNLDYQKCETDPVGAFTVTVMDVNISTMTENPSNSTDKSSNIPILGGHVAKVKLRFSFDPVVLRGKKICRGAIYFGVEPCLGTGDRELKIPCTFRVK